MTLYGGPSPGLSAGTSREELSRPLPTKRPSMVVSRLYTLTLELILSFKKFTINLLERGEITQPKFTMPS